MEGGTPSFIPVNLGLRQGCILAQLCSKVIVGNTKVTDVVSGNDAVIFTKLLEVLVMADEVVIEEVKPLELQVS